MECPLSDSLQHQNLHEEEVEGISEKEQSLHTYHPIGKMDRKLHVTSVNKSSGDHSIMFLQKVKEPSESVREESCQKQKGYGFQLTLCNSLILYHGRQTDNKNTLATGWPAVSIYSHHIKRGKGLREFGRR